MKKLLLVMNTSDIGGIETVILYITKYLNKDRFKVDVCFFDKKEGEKAAFEDEMKTNGCRILKLYSGNSSFQKYIEKRKLLYRWLKNNEYDIVHINSCYADDGAFCLIAKKCGVNSIIMHSHTAGVNFCRRNWKRVSLHLIARSIHLASAYSTHLISCSDESMGWMFGKVKDKPRSVIPNGIDGYKYRFDKHRRDEARKKLNVENNEFLIGNVGRLSQEKNQIYLVEVFKHMVVNDSNCKLIVLGEGEEKHSIQGRIRELGLDNNIRIIGNEFNVVDFYNAIDCFVMPSLFEGFGITCIEAQCCGLPCVVSDRVPASTNITNDVRYLSLEISEKEWADEIYSMKDTPRGKENYMVIEKSDCSAKKMVSRIEHIYISK